MTSGQTCEIHQVVKERVRGREKEGEREGEGEGDTEGETETEGLSLDLMQDQSYWSPKENRTHCK